MTRTCLTTPFDDGAEIRCPQRRVLAHRNRRALTARCGRGKHPAAKRTASTPPDGTLSTRMFDPTATSIVERPSADLRRPRGRKDLSPPPSPPVTTRPGEASNNGPRTHRRPRPSSRSLPRRHRAGSATAPLLESCSPQSGRAKSSAQQRARPRRPLIQLTLEPGCPRRSHGRVASGCSMVSSGRVRGVRGELQGCPAGGRRPPTVSLEAWLSRPPAGVLRGAPPERRLGSPARRGRRCDPRPYLPSSTTHGRAPGKRLDGGARRPPRRPRAEDRRGRSGRRPSQEFAAALAPGAPGGPTTCSTYARQLPAAGSSIAALLFALAPIGCESRSATGVPRSAWRRASSSRQCSAGTRAVPSTESEEILTLVALQCET